MEAERTSETSFDNYLKRQYILEDKSELHTRRRENLNSHMCIGLFFGVHYRVYKDPASRPCVSFVTRLLR
jgi:hypothetical protein